MLLANREAQARGETHIGTPHILLGLLSDGQAAAADVLKHLNVGLCTLRQTAEEAALSGRAGRFPTAAGLPFALKTASVIECAGEEAKDLKRKHVGPEHLFLGLLRVSECRAGAALNMRGIHFDFVRERVREWPAQRTAWLAWNDGTVEKMARAIVAEQRWEDLPILADALEDAGCTRGSILGHLRQPGEHACDETPGYGCWALEVLFASDEHLHFRPEGTGKKSERCNGS
jgi:ATP-dependent Clp protease ATP-binding subunit ClpA